MTSASPRITVIDALKANAHRRRRRNPTAEWRRVGSVNTTSSRLLTDSVDNLETEHSSLTT